MNNRSFQVSTEAALTGVQTRKKPSVKKLKFLLTDYSWEDQQAWRKVWHALSIDYFTSETYMSGSQVDTRITEIWRQHFPTAVSLRSMEPNREDYPEPHEIRRVTSLDELVNLKGSSEYLEYQQGY